MDKFFVGLIVVVAVLFAAAVYSSFEYEEKAEARAKVIGCEYLGSARDMRSVGFYECGDAIELKKIN